MSEQMSTRKVTGSVAEHVIAVKAALHIAAEDGVSAEERARSFEAAHEGLTRIVVEYGSRKPKWTLLQPETLIRRAVVATVDVHDPIRRHPAGDYHVFFSARPPESFMPHQLSPPPGVGVETPDARCYYATLRDLFDDFLISILSGNFTVERPKEGAQDLLSKEPS